MKGVRLFYHVEPLEKEWLVVFSALSELKGLNLPASYYLLLTPEKLRKFYRDYLVKVEEGLQEKGELVLKRYFLDERSKSLFCLKGVQFYPNKASLFRNISICGIPLLPDSEGLASRGELIRSALLMFGDEELAEEVVLVLD